jgi:hypothetical protein
MIDLTDFAIAAHGGLERWNELTAVSAHLLCGGVIWPLKGQDGVLDDVNVRVELHRQFTSQGCSEKSLCREFFSFETRFVRALRGGMYLACATTGRSCRRRPTTVCSGRADLTRAPDRGLDRRRGRTAPAAACLPAVGLVPALSVAYLVPSGASPHGGNLIGGGRDDRFVLAKRTCHGLERVR